MHRIRGLHYTTAAIGQLKLVQLLQQWFFYFIFLVNFPLPKDLE